MVKKLIVFAVFAFSTLAFFNAGSAQAAVSYDSFCHRSNSVTNPYQVVPFSTNYSEIDGVGNNDHTLHTGPVVTSEAQAQILKDAKISWGDIIPPVPGVLPAGYNWTAEGQAVYNAECSYPEDDDEPTPADLYFTVTCNYQTSNIDVTVVNLGDKDGEVTVNNEVISVPGNDSISKTYPFGTQITIVIDQATEYDEVPDCEQPEVPVTPSSTDGSPEPKQQVVASTLPTTSGENVAVTVAAAAGLLSVISFTAKYLYTKFI